MTQPVPPEAVVDAASKWWSTAIVDIHPGEIKIRGYPIEDLIGEISFAEMIWLMLRGDLPTRDQGALLEAALVAAVDHGPQAPSIAISRMAITCGAAINGAMASAINTLDDIHGGAGQQCMELLEQVIASSGPDDVIGPATVESVLDHFTSRHGKIVPGFGHRFHPVDPRAVKLLELVDGARGRGVVAGRFAEASRMIEKSLSTRKGRGIPMNIDGITAVIFAELGFPSQLARGLFILSRSVGILAHAWEQINEGGRIKGPMPRSIPYRYVGVPVRHLASGERTRSNGELAKPR
jgi:citrate synthase